MQGVVRNDSIGNTFLYFNEKEKNGEITISQIFYLENHTFYNKKNIVVFFCLQVAALESRLMSAEANVMSLQRKVEQRDADTATLRKEVCIKEEQNCLF